MTADTPTKKPDDAADLARKHAEALSRAREKERAQLGRELQQSLNKRFKPR